MDPLVPPQSFFYLSDATFLIDIVKSYENTSVEVENVMRFFEFLAKNDIYINVPTPIYVEVISYFYYNMKLSTKDTKKKFNILKNKFYLNILDYTKNILYNLLKEINFFDQNTKCHCGELCLVGHNSGDFCVFITSDENFLKGYNVGYRIDPRIYDNKLGYLFQNSLGEKFYLQ